MFQHEHDRLRNGLRPAAGLLLACLMAAAPALARQVDETAKVPAEGSLAVENIVGSIEVIGWDRDEITITGTLGEDVESLEFEPGRRSRIEVVYPDNARHLEDGADLVIHMPAGWDLEVECVSADITVGGVGGDLETSSVSGDVAVSGRCRKLQASSISGKVLVDGAADRSVLSAVSGAIVAQGKRGALEIDAVTASVEIVFDLLEDLSLSNVQGDTRVSGDLAPRARLEIEAVGGDVTLTVPAEVSAEFDLSTFSGDIDSDFGQEATRTSRYAPGREMGFTLGGGDAQVRINTLNGDVKILRK